MMTTLSLPSHKSSRWQNDGNDEAEETDSFGENQDEDHSYEQLRLDSIHANANVSYDSDGESSSLSLIRNGWTYKGWEPAAHACNEVFIANASGVVTEVN